MIRPDIEPIGHATPRKPVDLNPRAAVTVTKAPHRAGEISEQHARVWDAVVSTATGSNISGAAPEYPVGDEYQADYSRAALDAEIVVADFQTRVAEIVKACGGCLDWASPYYLNTDSDNDDYMG